MEDLHQFVGIWSKTIASEVRGSIKKYCSQLLTHSMPWTFVHCSKHIADIYRSLLVLTTLMIGLHLKLIIRYGNNSEHMTTTAPTGG